MSFWIEAILASGVGIGFWLGWTAKMLMIQEHVTTQVMLEVADKLERLN